MNTKALTGEILAGYAIAVVVYAVALYAAITVGDTQGRNIVVLCATASLALVAAATFRWGRSSGFPVISEERGFSIEFLLRNLVMTALVLIMLAIIASPVWALVFWFAAKR